MTPKRIVQAGTLISTVAFVISCGRESDEANRGKKLKAPPAVTRSAEGDSIVRVDDDAQGRIGLAVEGLKAASLEEQILSYGRLEEDPSQTQVVRAPVAGTLQTLGAKRWPYVGQVLDPGQTVGAIDPRIAPAERIALTTQLAAATSESAAAVAAVDASKAAYERASSLNADNKNVSDRVLQEARARLETEGARLEAARKTIGTLESTLRLSGLAGYPMSVQTGGAVIEVLAHPGEAVEAGLPLLRVSRLDRLMARLDLPLGQRLPAAATLARILPTGQDTGPMLADRVAASPVVDPKSPGESYVFRLREGRFGMRPGLAVTAYLVVPGQTRKGFQIPASAVVRLSGKAFLYTQIAPDQFMRKQIELMGPSAAGYFIVGRLSTNDRVVIRGAQSLLSAEFNPVSVEEE